MIKTLKICVLAAGILAMSGSVTADNGSFSGGSIGGIIGGSGGEGLFGDGFDPDEYSFSEYYPVEYAFTQSDDGSENRAYFKFDISGNDDFDLGLFYIPGSLAMPETGGSVSGYLTSSDWNPGTINWANQPEFGELIHGHYAEGAGYIAQFMPSGVTGGGNFFSIGLSSNGTFQNAQPMLFTASCSAVPEPVSTALFLLGGATLALKRLRRK